MATNIEEALKTLQGVQNNQVELSHLEDGSILIRIIPQKKIKEGPKKGKWAGVAEEMAEENLLRNGLGDELREHVYQFRQNFVMKNPFDDRG